MHPKVVLVGVTTLEVYIGCIQMIIIAITFAFAGTLVGFVVQATSTHEPEILPLLPGVDIYTCCCLLFNFTTIIDDSFLGSKCSNDITFLFIHVNLGLTVVTSGWG